MSSNGDWSYIIILIVALIIGLIIVFAVLNYIGYWNLIPK